MNSILQAAKMSQRAVRDLVRAGANVDATDADGRTALIQAAREGHADAARALVDAGANVEATDNGRMTALMWAARAGHADAARALLAARANVEATVNGGMTALTLATIWGHEDAVRVLVDAGADVNVADIMGRTPFNIALRYYAAYSADNTNIIRILLPHVLNLSAVELQILRDLFLFLPPVELRAIELPPNHPLYADLQRRISNQRNTARRIGTSRSIGDPLTLLPDYLESRDMRLLNVVAPREGAGAGGSGASGSGASGSGAGASGSGAGAGVRTGPLVEEAKRERGKRKRG